MLPIPTLPALDPVADIVTNSVLPELTLKVSVTVKIPTWKSSTWFRKTASVKVDIPVENKFLKVRSSTSKLPVISTSLNVAIPLTFKLSRFKVSVPSKS